MDGPAQPRPHSPHVPALLADKAAAHGRLPAVSVNHRASLSYGDWWRRALVASGHLGGQVRPGELVALPFPAEFWPEYCIAYVACQLAGGIPVPCAAGMAADEWGRLASGCSISHVILPAGAPTPPLDSRVVVWPYERLGSPATNSRPPVAVDSVAHIMFTSGTTGLPKAVAATHAELLTGSSLPPTWAGRTMVHVMSPAAAAGTEGAMLLALKSGLHATTVAPMDVAALVDKIADPATSVVLLTPSVAGMCARSGRLAVPAPHVKLVMLMGSATPERTMRELTRYFNGGKVVGHYGATEAGAAQLLMPFDPRRPGAVGRALGDTDVRVSVSGSDAATGEVGEVLLRRRRAPQRRYLQVSAEPAVFADDGWVHTGDLGYLDEDGYLYLLGRKKDIVIRGGRNIAPAEVEAALAAHPEVEEAAAFGVPHDLWGEMLVAAVVLRGPRSVAGADLRRFLRSHLAAFKVPSRVVTVDSLPRNAMGKVQKDELRNRYLGARGSD
jgi:acyl-CoA synthetase (AMP-forming)/AMP-acid ligase II